MSDDLISRSALKVALLKSRYSHADTAREISLLNRYIQIVDEQPTAYDVDEKIAKLEALKVPEGLGANCPYNRERCAESNCLTCILDYALDILKGGVE